MKYLFGVLAVLTGFNASAVDLNSKAVAIASIESVFLVPTIIPNRQIVAAPVAWPKTLDMHLDAVNWQLQFMSTTPIQISRISIILNNKVISWETNLTVLGSVAYSLVNSDFNQAIAGLTHGYRILEVTPQFKANQYPDLASFTLLLLRVSIDYATGQNFNQSTRDFLLVLTK